MCTTDKYKKLLAEVYKSIELPDSYINKYLDALALNIILKDLSDSDKKIFYKLLNAGKEREVVAWIYEKIPEFEDLLVGRIKEVFKVSHA